VGNIVVSQRFLLEKKYKREEPEFQMNISNVRTFSRLAPASVPGVMKKMYF
jgi:hypothetical protein